MTGFTSKRQAAMDKLVEIQEELGMYDDQKPPMTKDEALKQMLNEIDAGLKTALTRINELVAENKALKEALEQPEQEPVAWGVFEGNLHDMFFTEAEAVEMAHLKGSHAEVRPLYTTPPAAQPVQEPVATMKMLHTYGDTALKEKNHE